MALLLALREHPGASAQVLGVADALLEDLHKLALVDFAPC